jgi:hypothetical protein
MTGSIVQAATARSAAVEIDGKGGAHGGRLAVRQSISDVPRLLVR